MDKNIVVMDNISWNGKTFILVSVDVVEMFALAQVYNFKLFVL